MAINKVFAIALCLAVRTTQADNCNAAASHYQLKTTALATTYCPTDVVSCTAGTTGTGAATVSNCPCGSKCCEKVPNKCSWAKDSTACGADRYADSTKQAVAVLPAKTDYDANCCTAKKTCDATCSAGYKNKATYTTIKCSDGTCSKSECCDVDTSCTACCMSVMLAGTMCPSATHYLSGITTAATTANFEATCCTVKKTCDATCNAGMKNKADYATIKCSSGTCSKSECCDADPATCLGLAATGCAANHAVNAAALGTAATAANYKATCCVAKGTCQAFKDQVNIVAASNAVLPEVRAVTLLFTVAMVVFGN